MFGWILLCQVTSLDSAVGWVSCRCRKNSAWRFCRLGSESYKSLQRYRLSMTILTNISSHHATTWGMHNIIMHYQWIQFGPMAYECLWYPRTFLTEILQAPFLLVFRQTSCIYTSQTECVSIYIDGTSLSNGIPQLSCTVYSVLVVVSVYQHYYHHHNHTNRTTTHQQVHRVAWVAVSCKYICIYGKSKRKIHSLKLNMHIKPVYRENIEYTDVKITNKYTVLYIYI